MDEMKIEDDYEVSIAILNSAITQRCPYCGTEEDFDFGKDHQSFFVYCNRCGASGPLENTKHKAARSYNARWSEDDE